MTMPSVRPVVLFGSLFAASAVFGLSEQSEDITPFLDRKARLDAQTEQQVNTREEILLLQREAQERVEQFHRLPGYLLTAVSRGELSREEAIQRARQQPGVPAQQPQTAPAKAAKTRYIRLALVATLVVVLSFFHLSRSRNSA